MRLPDYNLNPPDYDDDRSEYIISLLQQDFDQDYLCEADVNTELMLKFVKGAITDDELEELRTTLQSDYELAFATYVDANYQKKVDDMNDPY